MILPSDRGVAKAFSATNRHSAVPSWGLGITQKGIIALEILDARMQGFRIGD
ncbi:MAG: hypothetical protein KME26_05970 [Oscillatoria princeps RMCB-10]|jgi:hypothetical protein|nr:hypothetical protein [Oscillatoria princeps RMCB-10]